MRKKIFVVLFLVIFLSVNVGADIIGEITMDGALSFLDPTLATLVKGVMCTAGPGGALVCIEQYIGGKVVGVVAGGMMKELSKASPKAYELVTTYNQVKSYIDKGASVLKELEIDERGEIKEGKMSFGEEEYSLKELLPNVSAEDIIVSKAEYDFKTKTLEIKDGGYLKLKVEDEDGNVQELDYENIKEGGYFKFDDKGVIREADIISSDSSSYQFGEYEDLNVEADTRVEYKNGELTVTGKDEFSYGDLLIDGNIVVFDEDEIICDRCRVGDISLGGIEEDEEGILVKTDDGFLVKYGQARYKSNLLKVEKASQETLIADPNADLSSYNGNWLKQTENSLEMKSIKDGEISLEILESHDILNTDSKDKLNFQISNGDGLKVDKREDEGLIPELTAKNGGGKTVIENNKLSFTIEDNKILDKASPLAAKDLAGKYQSVAFEIKKSDSDIKIRVNSYSQYVLTKRGNELISYNQYDLPMSARIEDNSLQTLGQLREKYRDYPNLKFEIAPGGGFVKNALTEENIPPYMLYLTDNFLEKNPEATEIYEKIEYTSLDNAWASRDVSDTDTLTVGFVVDPYSPIPIREMTSPFKILTHEYEHTMNYIAEDEEWELINSFGDNPELNSLFEKKKILEEEMGVLSEQIDSFAIGTKERNEAVAKIISREKELAVIKMDMEEGYYKNPSHGRTLQQVYNELALTGTDKLAKSESFRQSIRDLCSDIERNYIREELSMLTQEIEGEDLTDFLRDKVGFYGSDEEILKQYESDFYSAHKEIINSLFPKVEDEEVKTKLGSLRLLNSRIDDLNYWGSSPEKEISSPSIYTSELNKFYESLEESPELNDEAVNMDQLVKIHSGLPYTYSLKNYEAPNNKAGSARYSELPTTYMEQPIETIKSLVESGNKLTKEEYRILTNIAFDRGVITTEEFKQIMGEGYCKKSDCSDRICTEYKLLCCIKNPSSPNC